MPETTDLDEDIERQTQSVARLTAELAEERALLESLHVARYQRRRGVNRAKYEAMAMERINARS